MKKMIYGTIGAICVSLMALSVIGNLFLSQLPEAEEAVTTSAVLEQRYTEEQLKSASTAALFSQNEATFEEDDYEIEMENQIASLRMERDSSWQRLRDRMEQLSDEYQQKLQTYALLQYKEQRLELLLQARGVDHCLVVLEEHQANVIAAEDALKVQYKKIYDLIQRNSDYTAEQIVLVPMKTQG